MADKDISAVATTDFNSDIQDAVSKKHSHANKTLLDSYDQSNADIQDAVTHKDRTDNPHSVTASQVGAITKVEDDPTPKLGGDLVLNGYDLSGNDRIAKSTKATRTIYCNYSTGSDTTGDGTSSNPFKTIQKAIDSLPDIISEDVTIAVGADETLSTPITFAGHYVSNSLTLEAQDSSGNKLYDDGTATGGSSTTLQDTSKSWATDFWKDGYVFIYQGTGAGEIRTISGNTGDTLTISSGTTPDTTSDYVIVKITIIGVDTSTRSIVGIPDNLKVYGFRFTNAQYALSTAITDAKLTGHKGLDFEYNLVDTGSSGLSIDGFHGAIIQHNLFKIVSFGVVIGYYSYSSPRNNCFVASSSGSGTGIYVYGSSIASLHATELNTYLNLDKGIWAAIAGVVKDASRETYSGCSTNYIPAGASDPSYCS